MIINATFLLDNMYVYNIIYFNVLKYVFLIISSGGVAWSVVRFSTFVVAS